MNRAATDEPSARAIHLAIDAVGTRADSGGAVVLGDLLRAIADEPRVSRTTVFVGPALARRLPLTWPEAQLVVIPKPKLPGRVGLLWWNLRGLESHALEVGARAIVSLNGMGRARSLPIFLLFQQQLMFAPRARERMGLPFRARFALMSRLTARACRAATAVFTQGEHVSQNVVQQLGVPRDRVHALLPDITWHGPAVEPTPERDASLLVYVGSNQPHKSLATLLDGFARLRSQRPELRLALTLSAAAFPVTPGALALGRLQRGEVRRLLQRASLMVMPSLAETVGLPLLEAFDAGCNVVAVDLPYAREVCGEAAVYFKPSDGRDCAAQVAALLDDPTRCVALATEGRRRLEARRSQRPYEQLLRQLLRHCR